MIVSKRKFLVFFITFVFFAGNNIGSLVGINTIIKLLNNILTLYMLFDICFPIIKTKKIEKITPVTVLFLLYLIVYVVITLAVGGELIFNNITMIIKSAIVLVWLDRYVRADMTLLEGPILAAFYIWCFFDTVITLIYPAGAPFLMNGYILGWKNNKIMYFIITNLLSAYHYINLDGRRKRTNFLIVWGMLSIGCIANAILIESSTTAMVVVLIALFVPLRKIITRTPLVNGKFVLGFHAMCFVLIIFVRELFQEPLDQIMNVLFGKDASFTGRIYIWRAALIQITKSPIWGYGKYETQYAILPSQYGYAYEYPWTMAHNQILDLMLRGGIIILALWLGVLFIIIRKNQKNKSIYSKLSTYTLFCSLFFFHTEASMDAITYLIFLCLYLIGQKENNKGELKRKRYEVTKE